MSFGDFGSWSPKDHALNKMIYDKAHKNGGSGGGGGDNNNSGCAVIFTVIIIVILIWLFSR